MELSELDIFDKQINALCALMQHCVEKVEFYSSEPGDPYYLRSTALSAKKTASHQLRLHLDEPQQEFAELIRRYPEPPRTLNLEDQIMVEFTSFWFRWDMIRRIWALDPGYEEWISHRKSVSMEDVVKYLVRIGERVISLRQLRSFNALRQCQQMATSLADDENGISAELPVSVHHAEYKYFSEVIEVVKASWAVSFKQGNKALDPGDFERLMCMYIREKTWELNAALTDAQALPVFDRRPTLFSLFPERDNASIYERVTDTLMGLRRKVLTFGQPVYIYGHGGEVSEDIVDFLHMAARDLEANIVDAIENECNSLYRF